jgi:hypothetical protein
MPAGAEFEPLDGIGDIDAADAEVEFTVESFGVVLTPASRPAGTRDP